MNQKVNEETIITNKMNPDNITPDKWNSIEETISKYLRDDNDIDFQRFLEKNIVELKKRWDNTWKQDQHITKENFLSIINQLEEITDQIKFTGLLCIKYNRKSYFEKCFNVFEKIMKLPENLGGAVHLLSIPGYLIFAIYNLWGSYAIKEEQLDILNYLFTKQITYYPYSGKEDIENIYYISPVYHPEIFDRRTTDTADYYMKTHQKKNWITQFFDNIEDDITTYYVQFNWIICMKIIYIGKYKSNREYSIWADFGRFYEYRLRSLLVKIKKDNTFGKEFCKIILDTSPNEFWESFDRNMDIIIQTFWSRIGYHYASITRKEDFIK